VTADDERQIHGWHTEGISNREIARRVGMSHVSVAKVLKRTPPPLEVPAHMRAPAPVPPADDAPADDAPAIEQARYLMREAREALRAANTMGDSQLAQRQTRNAAFLMNVLARLERDEDANAGGFHITAEEVARTEATIDSRIKALSERLVPGPAAPGGIRCTDCGRALSIAWGTDAAVG
jgi:hypothetical protein